MSEKLYESVSLFNKCEEIISGFNQEMRVVGNNSCDRSRLREGCNDNNFYRNYLIAEKYLNHFKDMGNSRYLEYACKYFSYWAYKEMLKDKKIYSYSVPKLCEIIMQGKDVHICKDYVEDITPEIILNIEMLRDLYKNLNNILTGDDDIFFDCNQAKICTEKYYGFKETCSLKSEDPFCSGIETFREGYNKTMERSPICEEYKILPPFQKRPEKSANTIATVAVTAISFASIMTYKFTPLGSWVRHRLSGNKNLRNKLEKEFTTSQNSSELQNMEYRVPYNSS